MHTDSCTRELHCGPNASGSLHSRQGVLRLLNVLDNPEDTQQGTECYLSKAGGSSTGGGRRAGKKRRTGKESLMSPFSIKAEEQLTCFHFFFFNRFHLMI